MNEREWAEFEMFLDTLSEEDFDELRTRLGKRLEVQGSPAALAWARNRVEERGLLV